MERINALLAERADPNDNRSRKEITRAAWTVVTPVIQAIFADLPNVNIMAVEGYRPWFNDGDECVWGINVMVDWYGSDDLYHSPCHMSPYGDSETDGEYNALFTRQDVPKYQDYQLQPDYENLKQAAGLLATLSDELKIIDEHNGTWWIFVRDENAENGFRIDSGEFEHD